MKWKIMKHPYLTNPHILDENGELVCEVYRINENDSIIKANLIVATPELLMACKEAEAYFEVQKNRSRLTPLGLTVLKGIQKAIAKAGGNIDMDNEWTCKIER